MSIDLAWTRILACPQNVSEIVSDYVCEDGFTIKEASKFQGLQEIFNNVLACPQEVSKIVVDYMGEKEFTIVDDKKIRQLKEIIYKLFSDYQNIFQNYSPVIIYLDIDEVMYDSQNTEIQAKVIKEYGKIWGLKNKKVSQEHVEKAKVKHFDADAINNLSFLLQEVSSAVIVISSFWRNGKTILELRELFTHFGKYVIDKTENIDGDLRTEEVLAHIKKNKLEKNKKVIFDDQLYGFLESSLSDIYINVKKLLTFTQVLRAVSIVSSETF
jgi:hypothetical protein